MFRYAAILLLTLTLIVPLGAQDEGADVEGQSPVATQGEQPNATSQLGTAGEVDPEALARAIGQVYQMTQTLAVRDADTDALPDGLAPMLLAAVIADCETEGKVEGTDAPTVRVTCTPQHMQAWLQAMQASPQASEAFRQRDFSDLSATLKPVPDFDADVRPSVDRGEFLTPPGSGNSLAEPPLWKKHVTGQGRLLAERAGKADAMQRLASRVRDIRITDDLTVGRMIERSRNAKVDVAQFLRSADVVGLRCRKDALIFEVLLETRQRATLASISSWIEAGYDGEPSDLIALREVVRERPDQTLREIGSAMPPVETLRDLPPEMLVRLQAVTGQAVPLWATREFQAAAEESDDAAQAVLHELLMQVWSQPMANGLTLGHLAAHNKSVLDAVILAALKRDKTVDAGTGDSPRMLRDTMTLQPAWQMMASDVLADGLMPYMKPTSRTASDTDTQTRPDATDGSTIVAPQVAD